VCLNVVLRRVFRVLAGMDAVSVGQVRVVCGLFVVPRFVLRGGFVVVARSVLMVLRCLFVMMGCYLRHVQPPNGFTIGLLGSQCGLSRASLKPVVKAKRIQDEYLSAGTRGWCGGAGYP
jgi:hypothetical protein